MGFFSFPINAQLFIQGDAQLYGEHHIIPENDSVNIVPVLEGNLKENDNIGKIKNNHKPQLISKKKSSIKIKYKTKLVLKCRNSDDNSYKFVPEYDKVAISNNLQNNQKSIIAFLKTFKILLFDQTSKIKFLMFSVGNYKFQFSRFLSRAPPILS